MQNSESAIAIPTSKYKETIKLKAEIETLKKKLIYAVKVIDEQKKVIDEQNKKLIINNHSSGIYLTKYS